MKRRFAWRLAVAPFLLLAASGCVEDQLSLPLSHPLVAPAAQPAASLKVDASQIRPMYDHRLLAVDLPTVVRVAMARNIDVKEAQENIEASRGAYESSVGAFFPSLTPNITALGIQGAISSSSGLAVAALTHFFPAAAIPWIINPGQVAYNVIVSKRRLEASEEQDRAVVLETTRAASVQYYDLALNQAQVSVAWQAIKEAEELLRIERLRLKAGTALQADELRAEADLALKQQNLLNALNGFYNASVTLTVTLDLDPTVMLVPRAGTMRQATLVREDLPIDEMLVTAVRYRPIWKLFAPCSRRLTPIKAPQSGAGSDRRLRRSASWHRGRPPEVWLTRNTGSRFTTRPEASTGAPRLSGGLRARPPT